MFLTHGPPQSPNLIPTEDFWDVLVKTFQSGLIIQSSIQDPGEKLM